MRFRSNRSLTLGVAAVGLGVTAMQASAQQASFHLPFKAHWGSAVLEPGDYKLSAPIGVSGSHMIQLEGSGKSSMIVPAVTEIQQPNDRSYLELINVKGTYFVKRYKTASSGQVFHFGLPNTSSIPVEDATK